MRSLTFDWLLRANEDLQSAGKFLADPASAPQVAYYSGQCIEKSFRAVAEYKAVELPESYDLVQMAKMVIHYQAGINLDLISRLSKLTTDAGSEGEGRFSAESSPAQEEAVRFRDLAEEILKICVELCKDENDLDTLLLTSFPFSYLPV